MKLTNLALLQYMVLLQFADRAIRLLCDDEKIDEAWKDELASNEKLRSHLEFLREIAKTLDDTEDHIAGTKPRSFLFKFAYDVLGRTLQAWGNGVFSASEQKSTPVLDSYHMVPKTEFEVFREAVEAEKDRLWHAAYNIKVQVDFQGGASKPSMTFSEFRKHGGDTETDRKESFSHKFLEVSRENKKGSKRSFDDRVDAFIPEAEKIRLDKLKDDPTLALPENTFVDLADPFGDPEMDADGAVYGENETWTSKLPAHSGKKRSSGSKFKTGKDGGNAELVDPMELFQKNKSQKTSGDGSPAGSSSGDGSPAGSS